MPDWFVWIAFIVGVACLAFSTATLARSKQRTPAIVNFIAVLALVPTSWGYVYQHAYDHGGSGGWIGVVVVIAAAAAGLIYGAVGPAD